MAVDGNEDGNEDGAGAGEEQLGHAEERAGAGPAADAAPMTVTNTLSGGTVHGPAILAGRIGTVIVNPAPARGGPPQATGGGPFPLGALPPLASAFQSRDDVHGRLAAALAAEAPAGVGLRSAVLAGGGGVGKSQLAAAWAHRAADTGADLVLWVDATDVSNVLAQYARAAAALGVPGTTADPADTERDAAAFLSWLTATDGRWLLVLDDVTDFTRSAVWPTRARNPASQVLATTRLRDATVSSAGRTIVEVGLFSRDESLAFLRSRLTGAGRAELLDESADRLAEVLGHLPLALGHAAAYTVRNGCTTGEYLDRFTARSADLDSLMPAATDAEKYGRPVTTALLVALEAAQREEPVGLAVPAMQLAAVLDPAGHPRQLWTEPAVLAYLAERRWGPDHRITGRSHRSPCCGTCGAW
ncbi:NB-ARC domain-containing protein [Kitasatospora sp. NPDC048538]|uniref:NB-ARC domain-containing protein n=1 Tax=unclassified Kitasatospora TaxID=2633591 RepID=UPI0033F6DC93